MSSCHCHSDFINQQGKQSLNRERRKILLQLSEQLATLNSREQLEFLQKEQGAWNGHMKISDFFQPDHGQTQSQLSKTILYLRKTLFRVTN